MEETQEIDIPREELVKGAKILKQWADSIGVKVFSPADFKQLLVIVSTELEYEEELRGKYGMEILLHSYIHSRFEYLCKIISFIMHMNPQLLVTQVKNVMLFLFKIYKVLLPLVGRVQLDVEEDLYSVTSTADFKLSITSEIAEKGEHSWYHVCFTSVSILLHSLIVKFPHHVGVLRLTISEAMALTKSEFWQVQAIALAVLRSSLHSDLVRLQHYQREKWIQATEKELEALTGKSKKPTKTVAGAGVKGATVTAAASPSTKKLKSTPSTSKLDKQPSSLASASTRMESKSAGNISRAASQKFPECASGMWSAMVEQGIIPLLETCASGFLVAHSSRRIAAQGSPKFPEVPIRNVARLLLDDVIRHTETFVNIRQRLLTAMTYSGNQRLRLNLLCSVLWLCGQSPRLGSALWEGRGIPPTADARLTAGSTTVVSSQSFPAGGFPFYALCSSLTTDTNNAKQVFDILIHLYQFAVALHEQERVDRWCALRPLPNEIATQAGSMSMLDQTVHDVVQRLQDTLDPTVLVTQEVPKGIDSLPMAGSTKSHRPGGVSLSESVNGGSSGGRPVKMVCPKVPIIRRFSPTLADAIAKQHTMQLDEAASFFLQMNSEQGLVSSGASMRPSADDARSIERAIRQTISNFGHQYFLQLDDGGSYTDWQEVFSHMCNSTLRKKMLSKVALPQLCACLALAYRYEMEPLIQSYAEALHSRLSVATILPILRSAVMELNPASSHQSIINTRQKRVHLDLTLMSLEFLRKEWEFCVRRKDQQEVKEILQCLCTVIGSVILH
eukprot:gene1794-1300_t